jgi:hypothetical protein
VTPRHWLANGTRVLTTEDEAAEWRDGGWTVTGPYMLEEATATTALDELRRQMVAVAEWAERYDGEIAGTIRDVLDGRDFAGGGTAPDG